jgi:glycosyltransferase involved in cell wall biosynthesis
MLIANNQGRTTMRLIWIIDGLGHGGAEKMTLAILEKIDRSIFDLRVCALQIKQGNPIAKELERIGIPVDVVPIPNLRHPANLPKIISYLLRHKPDIVHTQLEFANVLGSIGSWIFHIPNISTIHTLDNPQTGTSHWRNELNWACMRLFSTRLIAVSDSTRKHLIENGRIPPKKIRTLYNGIDPANFKPSEKNMRLDKRRELGIPDNAFLILTIAVLREAKGIQYMVEAMNGIIQALPSAHYLIVGAGEYESKLREKVKSTHLERHITLAGQRTDIPDILAASDLFVLPTLIDALPTVLIEAMAAGKAIVATNVGGVPEIVEHNINGLLTSPNDSQQLEECCLQLAQDQGKREAMESAGLKIVQEKFNIYKQVSTLSQLYTELVNHG